MDIWEKSSLDVVIVEYFEGNLDNCERTWLSRYLQRNPWHQNDFNEWSHTFFMRNVPLEDYGISKKLIMAKSSIWKWFVVSR